jgi:hypothetical protein
MIGKLANSLTNPDSASITVINTTRDPNIVEWVLVAKQRIGDEGTYG